MVRFNRIRNKLLVVCVSFSLPITVMSVQMTKAKQKEIDFGTWELYGDKYQRPLQSLLRDISVYRWYVARTAAGDANAETRLDETRAAIDAHIAILNGVDRELGAALQFTPEGLGKRQRAEFTVDRFAQRWTALKTERDWTKAAAIDAELKALVAHLKTMITHSGDTSNLILDPDLDSYYLMDVTLLALPQMQDRLQEIAIFTEGMLAKARFLQEDRLQARVFAAFLKEADLDRVAASSQTSINEDQNFYGTSPTLKASLTGGLAKLTPAVTALVAQLNAMADQEGGGALDKNAHRAVVAQALEESYKFHFAAFDEEDGLVSNRLAVFNASLYDALIIGALCLLVSAILAFFVARNIVRRVRHMTSVTQVVARGDLAARVRMPGRDELAELGSSFDAMTGQIQSLNAEVGARNEQLKTINANLEGIVAERTTQIKTILDNVGSGFLLVGPDLKVQDGFSKSCIDLLGASMRAGADLFGAMGVDGDRNLPLWRAFVEQAFDDALPEEMTVQQLPPRIHVHDRVIALSARAVRNAAGKVVCILFSLIDATDLERAEKENVHHQLLVRLLREHDAFRDFVEESRTRLGLCRRFLRNNEQGKVRAELHTIKGNTAAFDLIEIAKLVHRIEDNSIITEADVNDIEVAFRAFLDATFEVLQLTFDDGGDESFTISRVELEKVMRSLSKDGPSALDQMRVWLEDIQFKSARSLIGALPDYASRLADRLCKQVEINVAGGETKMNPEVMKPVMQSLVHLVRNAIDHGIEGPAMRGAKGDVGHITIRCEDEGGAWRIDVADDGRGIDTEEVVNRALAKGIVQSEQVRRMTEMEKMLLIFQNGISTAADISEISGRGVGMNAVDAAVREAGGQLTVESKRGRGTTFSIRVQKARAKGRVELRAVG
jgi:nitrogen fixation/metabolism regulation signal transduction histidine kinase